MPGIELSESTYQRLLRRATSFSDTPEDVIQRLLEIADGTYPHDASSYEMELRRSSRASPGSILPEREYWGPILSIIEEAGGSAAANDVIDALGDRLRKRFTPGDLEVLQMGEVRWRNRARFARLRMREQGLLSAHSPRGVWEITALGRRYLAGDEGALGEPPEPGA
jgi:Mrr N-terminal domain